MILEFLFYLGGICAASESDVGFWKSICWPYYVAYYWVTYVVERGGFNGDK